MGNSHTNRSLPDKETVKGKKGSKRLQYDNFRLHSAHIREVKTEGSSLRDTAKTVSKKSMCKQSKSCNIIKDRKCIEPKFTKKRKSFGLTYGEKEAFQNYEINENSRLETEDNDDITVPTEYTNSVKRHHFEGFNYDDKLNIHVKEEDGFCNNSAYEIRVQNQEKTSSEENESVESQEKASLEENLSVENVEKNSSEENESIHSDLITSGKNEEAPLLYMFPHFLKLVNNSDRVVDELSKSLHNFTLKCGPGHILSAVHPVSDAREVVRHSLERIKGVDSNEVNDFKELIEYETKPFKMEEKDGNVELMELLLSQKHFQIRTDILVYMTPQSKWHPQAIEDIPWNWLNEEKWRLHTYSRYPHSANKSAILLAEAGFAYLGSGTGSDDRVICYFCCAIKQDWRTTDVISVVHKDLSPDCSIVTGIDCNNVPMTVPECGVNLFSQLHNFTDVLANGNKNQRVGHDIDNGIESDSPHVSGQQANQRRQHLQHPSTGNSKNFASAHVAKPIQMANQTVMKPSASSSSTSGQTSSRPTQPSSSNVPHSAITWSRNPTNSLNPNAVAASTLQTTGGQESQNNTSSSRASQAVTASETTTQTSIQNVQQLSEQTAASSSTVFPQAISIDQNYSVVTVSAATTTSSTSVSSTTAAASTSSNTSNINQSTNPPQGQANTSQTTTGETQNSTRTAGRNPTYGELGIITERPKRYEFAVRHKRYESFEHWPRDHRLKKEDLADAGFYYAGYGDCARCFYCGGGLRNWEDNDNVLVEHARWFPKCAFIRQTMGQQFVDVVQDLNKNNDQISFEMVTEKMGSTAASFQLDTKNMPLKRDPAVITVLAMGYSERDVFEAANFVKELSGMLSADKLFEKLEQDGKQRVPKETPADSQAICRNADVYKDEMVMNQLKEQNSQLRQQTLCKICMDKEVAVVFLPCGHLVSCTDCAAALKDCPVCRNSVRGIVRAFMA